MLGWDTMISFTFMCNKTGNGIDANLGTSGNGNTPLGPQPIIITTTTLLFLPYGWDLLSTYVLTRCWLTHLGTEEDYDFGDEVYHED
jgi:hypothetical protein